MPSIGGWEWIIILVIVIIIFGVGKLPEIGGALGKSIREFRESSKTDEESGGDESVNESKA
jgi:sec-independent protein translocase protein TatA